MRITKFKLSVAALCLVTLTVSSCGPSTHHRHKRPYSRIYKDSDGNYYTRTYDPSNQQFWFWMYVADSGGETSSSSPSLCCTGGSWSRVQSAPPGLTPTSRVISDDKKGEPTEEEAEEAAVAEQADLIDESTTQSQAAAETVAEAEGVSADSSGDASGAADSGGGGGDTSGE